jgi:hypothetical protein
MGILIRLSIRQIKLYELLYYRITYTANPKGILFDLIIYISVMFLIREVVFPKLHSVVNGLFWTFTTLAVATWRMNVCAYSWKNLGLRKPESIIAIHKYLQIIYYF